MATRTKRSTFFPNRNLAVTNSESRQKLRRLIVENLEQRCLLTGSPGFELVDIPEGEYFSDGGKGDYSGRSSGNGDDGGFVVQGSSSFTGIVEAFNSGLAFMRDPSQVSSIVNHVFGIQLPLVAESISEIVGAAEKFVTPFLESIQDDSSASSIQTELAGLGFTVEYVGVSPDASGDLLRAKFEKTWGAEVTVLDFSTSTGFSYFDSGVDGTFDGQLTASLLPVTLSATLGVDSVNGGFQFFVADGASLTVGGISIAGQVTTNLAIRNLLDVDVNGPVSGNLSGALELRHPTQEAKLRLSHFSNIPQIATGAVVGSLHLNPTLTAQLPMIGELFWGGQFSASVAAGNVSLQASVEPPSAASVMQLFQPAYSLLAGSLDVTGGIDMGSEVPVVQKSLGELLGLPDFLTSGLGGAVADNLISPDTVLKLINGEVVDLIRLERSGGDEWSETYVIFLGAVTVPLGPIPLTASAHLSTSISANYSYHVGLGLDTVGLYIDQGTSIRASAGIETGITGSLSVLGLAGAELTAGVGARVYASASFVDPNPSDGRIYIDELINHNASSFGEALINSVAINLGGEAYGFARAIAYFLWWDWELFNERFTIAEFSTQFGGRSQPAIPNPQSHRAILGREPLGSGQLPVGLLQNGVLTLDARNHGRNDKANVISVKGVDENSFEVTWRGLGQGIYSYSQVSQFVFHGNELADRLFIDASFDRPVLAYGSGGNDVLDVRNSHSATLYGGNGNDTLRGGTGNDWLYGEAGEDSIYGSDGNDHLSGNDGNDVLDGGSGNDTLLGGEGDDLLYSASGNNWIDGGDGNDAIQGGTGNDTLKGGLGNDFIEGISGSNLIEGESGNDTLLGGSGNDVIMGGEGDDLIFSGAGNDTLYGDEGNDTLVGESGDNELSGGAGDDFLFGGSGNDTLYGGADDDWLHGGNGNDVLYGEDGNDTLSGGAGNDTLNGGGDDDQFQLDFASAVLGSNDSLLGGIGQDTLSIVGKSSVDTIDGQPIVNTDYDDYIELQQLSSNEFVALNRHPETGEILDQLYFSIDNSTQGDIEFLAIFGLGGNDKLMAATGFQKNLRLDGGPGNDSLFGGMGNDTLYAGPGDDQLFGVAGNNILYGESGNNTLQGGTGNDVIYGGSGNDSVVGGFGREVINGGGGNNRLVAGQSIYGSIITGGTGNDTIIGGPGRDVLISSTGGGLILGGDLGDVIIGGNGNDTLVGESGQDTIYGTAGSNLIFTELNNELRTGLLGLPPIPELTTEEINAKEAQIEAERTYWLALRSPLLAIPPHLRTPEQQADLARFEDILAHLGEILIDLLQYQSVTVNTAVGGDGNDTIHGSSKRDFLFGGDGNDDIHYYGNQDTIVGGSGDDTVWWRGTDGNDLIHMSANPIGGTGNLRVLLQLNGSLLGALDTLNVERLGALGLGGDDTITVNFGNQALIDVMIDGGSGNDYIAAGTLQSNAILIGGSGNDTLIGGMGHDLLEGQTGDDELDGSNGNDTVIGGEGNDLIHGGLGADSIIGGVGNDTIFGGEGDDWIAPGVGNNTVNAGSGNNSLIQPNINSREVRVNETWIDEQNYPSIAVAADGSYVTTWMSKGPGGRWTVFARAFASDGTPTSSEFPVDDSPSADQRYPSIAMSSNGNYVISWVDHSPFGGLFVQIYARRFDSTHQPISPALTVWHEHVSEGDEVRPKVAMASDGRFVVVFQMMGQDGSGWGVFQEHFGPNNERSGVWPVNLTTTQHQRWPHVSMASDGRYVIAWTTQSPDPEGDIYARMFDWPGSALGGEVLINQNTALAQRFSPVSMADDHTFVVTWTSWQAGGEQRAAARRFSNVGTPLGDEFFLQSDTIENQGSGWVSVSPNGSSVVIVWQHYDENAEILSLRAKRFDGNGQPQSEVFWVTPPNLWGERPEVKAKNDGSFVVIWGSQLDPDGGHGISVRQWNNHTAIMASPASADRTSLSVQFSEPLFDSGEISVTSTENWRLYSVSESTSSEFQEQLDFGANFENITEPILSIEEIIYEYDPVTRNSAARLLLGQLLMPGKYILAASPRLKNLAGFGLDGDADGVEGGYFVYAFEVAAPPLAVEPAKQLSNDVSPSTESSVAVNPITGNYVSAWLEPMPSSPGALRVVAQLFSPSGAALSEKFQANSIASPNDEGLSVAMSTTGAFAISWNSGNGIFVRHFSSNGLPIGGEQRVNAVTPGSMGNHQISMDSQGNAVVTWVRGSVGTRGVFAVLMNAQGALIPRPEGVTAGIGNFEFRVDEQSSTWNDEPSVAMAGDGSFVIGWQRLSSGSTYYSISAKRYDSSGMPVAPPASLGLPSGVHEFPIAANSTADSTTPSVAMNESGEFALAWIDHTGSGQVMAKRFDSQGRPRADALRLDDNSSSNRSQARIALDRDANMAIFWRQQPLMGTSSLHLRWFDRWANMLSDESTVAAGASDPGIAMDRMGNFVLVWNGTLQNSQFVYSQRYSTASPVVTGLAPSQDRTSIVVGFSQPMAETGSGSVLAAENWGLLRISGTASQNFLTGSIDSITFEFNVVTGQYQAMVHLDQSLLPGNYRLIARRALTNAVGVRLDGNNDGISGDDFFGNFSIGNSAPSPSVDGPAIVQLGDGAVLTLSANDPDPGDDLGTFTYSIDWNGDGVVDQTSVGGAQLEASYEYVAAGNYEVQITVTDQHGLESQLVTRSLRVNHQPTIIGGGPYVVVEGQSLSLDAGGSFDPDGDALEFSWDINSDGLTDASGSTPTFNWQQLLSLGIADGPENLGLWLRVEDAFGGLTVAGPITLQVVNTPPEALIQRVDSQPIVQDQPVGFLLSALDVSLIDQQIGFTYEVHWGDGSQPTIYENASGQDFFIEHTYATSGSKTITVFATDKDGGRSLASVLQVFVEGSSAEVVGSRVYHRGSSFDSGNLDAALDTGKLLAKEGLSPQALTYNNLINTTRGINGLVFDIQDLAGVPTASDFMFQWSPLGTFNEAANPPANWQVAVAPSGISVIAGNPDRVLLEWPDNAIANRWLRVTIRATSNTGLAAPEVYYLGHLRGETTGLSGSVYTVSFADITPIRSAVGQTVGASSIVDIDKNGTVAFADISAMRASVGAQLTNITIPAIGGSELLNAPGSELNNPNKALRVDQPLLDGQIAAFNLTPTTQQSAAKAEPRRFQQEFSAERPEVFLEIDTSETDEVIGYRLESSLQNPQRSLESSNWQNDETVVAGIDQFFADLASGLVQ